LRFKGPGSKGVCCFKGTRRVLKVWGSACTAPCPAHVAVMHALPAHAASMPPQANMALVLSAVTLRRGGGARRVGGEGDGGEVT
jgi:hypothetical protein